MAISTPRSMWLRELELRECERDGRGEQEQLARPVDEQRDDFDG